VWARPEVHFILCDRRVRACFERGRVVVSHIEPTSVAESVNPGLRVWLCACIVEGRLVIGSSREDHDGHTVAARVTDVVRLAVIVPCHDLDDINLAPDPDKCLPAFGIEVAV
jgi:hypothetical protein